MAPLCVCQGKTEKTRFLWTDYVFSGLLKPEHVVDTLFSSVENNNTKTVVVCHRSPSRQILLRTVCFISWFLGAFAKLWKATSGFITSIRPPVRPHETTRLPLDGFSWNLMYECFSKICRKNSSLIKVWEEWRILYVKAYIYIYICDNISLSFP